MAKAVVIINPKAGSGQALDYTGKIYRKLSQSFSVVDLKFASSPQDGLGNAHQACKEGVEAIFALGGDGTVSQILGVIASYEGKRPRFGIIPGGTFNGLARVLGIPMDIDRALEVFDKKNYQAIDVGKVNDTYYGYLFSIGDIAEAIHSASSEEKSDLGLRIYAKNIAQRLKNEQSHLLHLVMDGEKMTVEVSHVLATMTNTLGRLTLINENKGSVIGDGYMNFYILKPTNTIDKITLIGDLLAGRVHENPNIIYRRIKHLEIYAEHEVYTDIEGDLGPKLPVKVDTLKARVEAYYNPNPSWFQV